jgi:hypothetical protein
MYLGGSHKGRGNDMLALIVVSQTLKDLILKSYHTSSLAGHFGYAKTYCRIRSKYFWKGLSRDAQDFSAACTICHSRKNPKRQKRNELGQRPTVWAPFQRISCDFLGVAPSARGHDHLVFTDSPTHWVEAFPTTGRTAQAAATILYDSIICRHGCPVEILTDKGSHFRNTLVDELVRIMQIRKSYTSPYRPQANGQTE